MLDRPDEVTDTKIAKQIISNFEGTEDEHLTTEELRDYIKYAKANINPLLSDGARALLAKYYVKARGDSPGINSLPVTPRQLQSFLRLAEAWAKSELSPSVNTNHIQKAYKLWSNARSV